MVLVRVDRAYGFWLARRLKPRLGLPSRPTPTSAVQDPARANGLRDARRDLGRRRTRTHRPCASWSCPTSVERSPTATAHHRRADCSHRMTATVFTLRGGSRNRNDAILAAEADCWATWLAPRLPSSAAGAASSPQLTTWRAGGQCREDCGNGCIVMLRACERVEYVVRRSKGEGRKLSF